jgi:hypothetical protein
MSSDDACYDRDTTMYDRDARYASIPPSDADEDWTTQCKRGATRATQVLVGTLAVTATIYCTLWTMFHALPFPTPTMNVVGHMDITM